MNCGRFQAMADAVLTFLGTGTSQGVPFIACDCAVCRSEDPRDQRLRSSLLVETVDGVLLVDTTPDFRTQALRHGLRRVDAVAYTHSHTDHVCGFDDLRRYCELGNRAMPVYATGQVLADLRRIFYYAFDGQHAVRTYIRPEPHEVVDGFEACGLRVERADVPHGRIMVQGYIFHRGDRPLAGYFSDCHAVPDEVVQRLQGIPVLILDALRHKPHPTHMSLGQALEVVRAVQPGRAFFTHLGHDLGHEETERLLPENVRLAYDGLRVEI